jgi:hypothetical protein
MQAQRQSGSWYSAVISLVALGAAPALAASNDLKLRVFENTVRSAYVIGDPLTSGTSDVLIEIAQTGSACGSQLFRWAGSGGPRDGMVVSAEQTESGADRATLVINACSRPLPEALVDEISWPRCPAPVGSRAYYWVENQAAQCLIELNGVLNVAAGTKTGVDIWPLPAVQQGTMVVSGLSELFDSASNPRAMRNLNFRPCHLWHLAATGMPQQQTDEQVFSSRHSMLLWSAYYLVDTGDAYACEPGERSRIDLLNRSLGRLGDGSAFVAGQRSVLAVAAVDGRSTVDTRLRRVEPEQLVEDLRLDGGPECTELGDEAAQAACKWIRDAGQSRVPEGKAGLRLWYQAFESAVRRIYFQGRN